MPILHLRNSDNLSQQRFLHSLAAFILTSFRPFTIFKNLYTLMISWVVRATNDI